MVKSPGFFVDCPFQRSNLENAYLKKEFEEMVRFLEDQSGQKMDRDKLQENIARMDREIELFRQIDDLRRNIPSPFLPPDFLKLFTVDCLFAGEPQAIEYLEAVCRELTEKVNAGRGIAYPERFRVLSIGIPPISASGSGGKNLPGIRSSQCYRSLLLHLGGWPAGCR